MSSLLICYISQGSQSCDLWGAHAGSLESPWGSESLRAFLKWGEQGMSAKTGILLLFLVCVTLGLVRSDFFSAEIVHKKQIQLDFWNGWTGPDGRVALEMIRDFNEKNPDVHVSMQRIAWALYYNKLMVAELDGRGPEVFVVHAGTLARMEHAGIMSDVDDLMTGPDAIPPTDFDPKVIAETQFHNDTMGVPLDIHPQGMYCNVDMLKSIGMTNPDGSARPPQNKTEFAESSGSSNRDEGIGRAVRIRARPMGSQFSIFDASVRWQIPR